MPEYSLEELQKRSLPALHNAELALLAGNEQLSPSKVYEIAAESYSERMAKAARFLAIVRRDYGTGVFKALVNNGTVEPAPSMEHVQENTMQKTQHPALTRIHDTKTRIKIMISLGLKAELQKEISELSRTWELYFEDGMGAGVSKAEVLLYSDDKDNPLHPFVLVLRDPSTFKHEGFDSHRSNPAIRIHLPGFLQIIPWGNDKKEIENFVSYVLIRTADQEVKTQRSSVDTGTLLIAKHFFGVDHDIFRKVELWFIRTKFATGRAFEMRERWLNTRTPDFQDPNKRPQTSKLSREAELDATVDRMMELGMTVEEARQDFLKVINNVKHNCRPDFMLAFMGAQCFGYSGEWDSDREGVLVNGYLDLLWSEYVRSGSNGPDLQWLRTYCAFLKFVSPANKLSDSRLAFYRKELTIWISQGYVAKVTEAFTVLGGTLSLAEFSEKRIPSFIPTAFTKAIEAGRCGVAVALHDQFGDQCFGGARPKSSKQAKSVRDLMIDDLRLCAKSLGQKTTLQ